MAYISFLNRCGKCFVVDEFVCICMPWPLGLLACGYWTVCVWRDSHCPNTRHVCEHPRAQPTNTFPLQLQCTYASHGIARRCSHKSSVNAEVEKAVWARLNLQKSSKFITSAPNIALMKWFYETVLFHHVVNIRIDWIEGLQTIIKYSLGLVFFS